MKNETGHTQATAHATKWGKVLLLLGAGIIVCFQIGKAPPMLPSIMDDLGMSLFAAGWILSIFNVIGLMLVSVIAAFSDSASGGFYLLRF